MAINDRKSWTLQEEDAMISIIEEIVANDDRSDNGSFRAGKIEPREAWLNLLQILWGKWIWKMRNQKHPVSPSLYRLPQILHLLPLAEHQPGKESGIVDTSTKNIISRLENSIAEASANIKELTETLTGNELLNSIVVVLTGLGFDNMQMIRVSIYFEANTKQLRIFNSLSDVLKVDFVKTILDL